MIRFNDLILSFQCFALECRLRRFASIHIKRVSNPEMDAKRPGLHYHAKRGNEKAWSPGSVAPTSLSACQRSSKNSQTRMSALRLGLFLSACFFLTNPAFSQEETALSVSSEVDRSTIKIGDVIEYRVKVLHGEKVQISWPSLGSNLGAFEIRDYSLAEPLKLDSGIEEVVKYSISTFDTGAFIIPPLIIDYFVEGDTASQRIQTDPIEIYVESVKPSEEGDLRGLKAQAVIERDWITIGFYIAFAVLGLTLIGLAIWYYRAKKRGQGMFEKAPPPPRPAHELAFEALAKLREEKLFADGRVEEYFVRLSEIIRTYISRRFHIPALELTTYEVMDMLAQEPVLRKHSDILEEMLSVSDLAKFARYDSAEEEAETVMQKAFTLVDLTKPVATPVENQPHDDASSDENELETPNPEKQTEEKGVPA